MKAIIPIKVVLLAVLGWSMAWAAIPNHYNVYDEILNFDPSWQKEDNHSINPYGHGFAMPVNIGEAFRILFPSILDAHTPIIIETRYGPIKQFLQSTETYRVEQVGRYLIYRGETRSILFRYDQDKRSFREFVYLPNLSSLPEDGKVIQWRFEGVQLHPRENGSVEVKREIKNQSNKFGQPTGGAFARQVSEFPYSQGQFEQTTTRSLFVIPSPEYINRDLKTHQDGLSYAIQNEQLQLVFNAKANLAFPLWVDPSMVSDLDAEVILDGQSTGDFFGATVASAGDFNNDGLDDVIVGAFNLDGNQENSGRAYIFFGQNQTGQQSLRAEADADVILEHLGINSQFGDQFGFTVASAGDFNGDGIDDVMVGAGNARQTGLGKVGKVYVFFGRSTAGGIQLTSDTDADVILVGETEESSFGWALSAGDFNGDGYDDVLVGAARTDNGSIGNAGKSFLFLGRPVSSQLTILSTNADLTVNGQSANEGIGLSVVLDGDFNGDGKNDAAISAGSNDNNGLLDSGSVFIFFGRTIASQLQLNPDTDANVVVDGRRQSDFLGETTKSVTLSGDFNGDGLNDLLVGAQRATDIISGAPNKINAGQAYVILGQNPGTQINLKVDVDASIIVKGSNASDSLGVSVDSLGDVNGDLLDDFIIGAQRALNTRNCSPIRPGSAYVFFTQPSATQQVLDANEDADVILSGQNHLDQFGVMVSGVRNFNSVGQPDLIIGAGLDDNNGEVNSGSAFLFYNLIPEIRVVACAGPDQTVDEGTGVQLDGTASFHSLNSPLNFNWTQIAGPTVTLDDPTSSTPTFTAPLVSSNQVVTFELIVNDGQIFSSPDTVDITVVNLNSLPVADAGDNSTVKPGAIASLDGSNSFDPDNEPITYQWSQVAGTSATLDLTDPARPTFTAPNAVGDVLVFKLQVSDDEESSTPSPGTDPSEVDTVSVTIVENSRPVADAGPDQTKDEANLVTLNGSGSSDADGGDVLSYQWTQTGGTSVVLSSTSAVAPTFTAPFVGAGGEDLTFELVVTDNDPVNPLSSVPDGVIVHVANINDPPSCSSATASLDLGWPPNHGMELVEIENIADPQNDGITVQITGVTQDEPVSGLSNGDSSPDAVIQTGNPADTVLLRLERDPHGNGRVYVVNFTASDGFESCTGSIVVNVPHSRKSGAVDDGQVYDSTQP